MAKAAVYVAFQTESTVCAKPYVMECLCGYSSDEMFQVCNHGQKLLESGYHSFAIPYDEL